MIANAASVPSAAMPAAAAPPAADPSSPYELGASDAAYIRSALDRLRGTQSGRPIAEFLGQEGVRIQVLPDADFSAKYPGAGAIYDPKTRMISVPRHQLDDADLVTTLAHEGKHAYDYRNRPPWYIDSLSVVGGSLGDGLKAAVTLRNPVTAWLDAVTYRQNTFEVDAYHLQAEVAHELGLNELRWAHGQARDGTPLPLDEVRANIAVSDLYRMSRGRRLVLGAGMGFAGTLLAGTVGQTIAAKLRPGSFLAQHAWPIYAVAGALTGAWIIGDQVRAARLDESTAQFNPRRI